jgi:hypothetical protein
LFGMMCCCRFQERESGRTIEKCRLLVVGGGEKVSGPSPPAEASFRAGCDWLRLVIVTVSVMKYLVGTDFVLVLPFYQSSILLRHKYRIGRVKTYPTTTTRISGSTSCDAKAVFVALPCLVVEAICHPTRVIVETGRRTDLYAPIVSRHPARSSC